jgi:hypothetical protein
MHSLSPSLIEGSDIPLVMCTRYKGKGRKMSREDVGGGDGSSCDNSDDASEDRSPVASLAAAAAPADSGDAEGGER